MKVPQSLCQGLNEVGFYDLRASDHVDPDPEIFVTDSGARFVVPPPR